MHAGRIAGLPKDFPFRYVIGLWPCKGTIKDMLFEVCQSKTDISRPCCGVLTPWRVTAYTVRQKKKLITVQTHSSFIVQVGSTVIFIWLRILTTGIWFLLALRYSPYPSC